MELRETIEKRVSTREILNEFVERIYIGIYNKETDNKDIHIKWRYQF